MYKTQERKNNYGNKKFQHGRDGHKKPVSRLCEGRDWFFTKKSIAQACSDSGQPVEIFKKRVLLGYSLAKKLTEFGLAGKLNIGYNVFTIKSKGGCIIAYLAYWNGKSIMLPYPNDAHTEEYRKYFSASSDALIGLNVRDKKYKTSKFRHYVGEPKIKTNGTKDVYRFFGQSRTCNPKFAYTLIDFNTEDFENLK